MIFLIFVKPPCANQTVKHNVVHYIDTFGPPVCAKPRRMAPDRALNAQTKKDKYPIPSILDFTNDPHGARIFSHIDLVKAFYQIPIASEDIHKTAICTPFGLFESTRMQFGLCNAASTFQRFIDEVTRGLKGVYAFIDILIASQNVQEHTTNLRALFERLDYYGLTIKPSKCTFGIGSLKFLGFQVSSEGISPLPDPSQCYSKLS
ncbi:hypothetical protein TNCV_4810451 [Trichonephila clavipes]|nr:hypothetical protein TNCV_4810451 [Trichonephila clavipes]